MYCDYNRDYETHCEKTKVIKGEPNYRLCPFAFLRKIKEKTHQASGPAPPLRPSPLPIRRTGFSNPGEEITKVRTENSEPASENAGNGEKKAER